MIRRAHSLVRTRGPSALSRRDGVARALKRLAAAPTVSVMCDFDGTIAAIRRDPCKATPCPLAMAALRDLAALPRTSVTVISGRGLGDLRMRVGDSGHVRLIGSYGVETECGRLAGAGGTKRAQATLDRLHRKLSRAVRAIAGVRIERKPLSIAMHFRGLPRTVARRACVHASRTMAMPGVRVIVGRSVLEWCVFMPCKAAAIRRIVGRRARHGVMCIGDDRGDAGALAMVHAWGGVAISVGRRRTGVPFGVRGVHDVARVLGDLLRLRARYVRASATHLASGRGRNARVPTVGARAHGRPRAAAARA